MSGFGRAKNVFGASGDFSEVLAELKGRINEVEVCNEPYRLIKPRLNCGDVTMEIKGLFFNKTCAACPEQYDVFKDGERVGYVRLRDSELRVDVPCCGDLTIMRNDLPWDDTDDSGGEFSGGAARIEWLQRVADAINSHGGKNA